MKLEINDKTGMIEADNQGFDEYWPADAKDLETILQAVKKTQKERGIENKLQDFIVYDERDGFLIQSIRLHIDFGYPVDLRKPSPTEIEKFIKHANIAYKKSTNKQIQEIQDSRNKDPEYIIHKLDETKKLFRKHKEKIEENQKIVDSLIKEFNDAPLSEGKHYANMLNNFVVKATGKDIKDLK